MRRTGRGSTLGLGAALTAIVLATAVAPATAGTTIRTRTFSNSQPITIPAGAPGTTQGSASPYPSEVNAGGFNQGTVLDVNLTLKNFSHTWPDDVDIMLSHRGRNATVMSDVGGTDVVPVSNITIILNDEASTALPDGGPLTGGAYRPRNVDDPGADQFPSPAPTQSAQSRLSKFDGMNPNGPWRLWVQDDGGGDVGQFAGGWSIRIKARGQT